MDTKDTNVNLTRPHAFEAGMRTILRGVLAITLIVFLGTQIACGAGDKKEPIKDLSIKPNTSVKVPGDFCGLWLNRTQEVEETGTRVGGYNLSFSYLNDTTYAEHWVSNGGSVQTAECGLVTYTGKEAYWDDGYLQPGGAGFYVPNMNNN